jgi:hypothetical protein
LEYKTDHDLFIELRVELRGMREDIKSMRDRNGTDIDTLKDDVASLKTTRAIAYAYAALITLILIPIVAAYIQAGKI